MNDLQIFKSNEFGEVRSFIKNGEPWFVAKDVCDILGLTNPSESLKALDDDEKSTLRISEGGPAVNIINESGLYTLVLRSRKPEAKKFKKWVTTEVLPSIRKYGAYMTDNTIEKALTSPDFLIQLATQLKEEREKRIQSEAFLHKIATSQNSLLVREVAKIASKDGFTIGEKRLWNKLRDWGLIFKNSTEPKQEYVDRGYFEVVEGVKETAKKSFTYRTTRVTGKGQVYIIQRLIKEVTKEDVC